MRDPPLGQQGILQPMRVHVRPRSAATAATATVAMPSSSDSEAPRAAGTSEGATTPTARRTGQWHKSCVSERESSQSWVPAKQQQATTPAALPTQHVLGFRTVFSPGVGGSELRPITVGPSPVMADSHQSVWRCARHGPWPHMSRQARALWACVPDHRRGTFCRCLPPPRSSSRRWAVRVSSPPVRFPLRAWGCWCVVPRREGGVSVRPRASALPWRRPRSSATSAARRPTPSSSAGRPQQSRPWRGLSRPARSWPTAPRRR